MKTKPGREIDIYIFEASNTANKRIDETSEKLLTGNKTPNHTHEL